MVTRGSGGGINWEIGIDIYTLLYTKDIANKDLLYSTGNSTQYSLMAYMGKESKNECRTSLVAQRLRIRLPMRGTRARALVWEDPTCCGATKPVRHNY